jgi:hypothetical protein
MMTVPFERLTCVVVVRLAMGMSTTDVVPVASFDDSSASICICGSAADASDVLAVLAAGMMAATCIAVRWTADTAAGVPVVDASGVTAVDAARPAAGV